jgi:hypothetical protein
MMGYGRGIPTKYFNLGVNQHPFKDEERRRVIRRKLDFLTPTYLGLGFHT